MPSPRAPRRRDEGCGRTHTLGELRCTYVTTAFGVENGEILLFLITNKICVLSTPGVGGGCFYLRSEWPLIHDCVTATGLGLINIGFNARRLSQGWLVMRGY